MKDREEIEMGLISKASERFGKRMSPTWLLPGLNADAVRAAEEKVERERPTAAELAERMPAEEYDEPAIGPTAYQVTILRRLQSKHVYAGTVPEHVTKRRRAKNKVARKTRRVQRQRAR